VVSTTPAHEHYHVTISVEKEKKYFNASGRNVSLVKYPTCPSSL